MRHAIALVALLLALTPAAMAFSVQPTALYLTEPAAVVTLTVTNGNDTTNVYQVGAAEWLDPRNPRKVGPTRDLVISPQVFRLKPGETGRVRIRAANGGIAGSGKAYRILARQVTPETSHSDFNVRIQVQFTVPLLTVPKR